jgi:hypothetical protein
VTAQEFINCKADKAGVRRVCFANVFGKFVKLLGAPWQILCELEDSNHTETVMGKLKISCIVEIVREAKAGKEEPEIPYQQLMNKPVLDLKQQRKALLSIVAQAKSQQAPGTVVDADEVEDVHFPVLAQVYRISLHSLDSVHRLSKNSPYVSISCGDWVSSTMVSKFLLRLCFMCGHFIGAVYVHR